jgi:hypothetical protein
VFARADSYSEPERVSLRHILYLQSSRSNILSRVRVVTIRRGLDWMIGFVDNLYAPLGTTGHYKQYSAIAVLHTLKFTVTHTH